MTRTSETIDKLPVMVAAINQHRAEVVDEASEVLRQWRELDRRKDQNDDRATLLLSRIVPALRGLSRVCMDSVEQIEAANAKLAEPTERAGR